MRDAIQWNFDFCANQRLGLGTAALIVMETPPDVIKGDLASGEVSTSTNPAASVAVPRRQRLDLMRVTGPSGAPANENPKEIDMLLRMWNKQVEGHTICCLGEPAAWPIQGLIRHFRDEIEDRIKHKRNRPVSAGSRPSTAVMETLPLIALRWQLWPFGHSNGVFLGRASLLWGAHQRGVVSAQSPADY